MRKFYTYYQNNSGGTWDKSMPHYLIVEATSQRDADERAEAAGAYFDGCETGQDCDCCGDRWHQTYEAGDPEPSVYGDSVETYVAGMSRSLYDGPEAVRVVYMDGKVVTYD